MYKIGQLGNVIIVLPAGVVIVCLIQTFGVGGGMKGGGGWGGDIPSKPIHTHTIP